jgi:hypothetical protein
MVPGALWVWWRSRYLPNGRACDSSALFPCDACLMLLDRARHDFALVWGPRLKAEGLIRRIEAVKRKPLTPVDRAEAEALMLSARELISALERAV